MICCFTTVDEGRRYKKSREPYLTARKWGIHASLYLYLMFNKILRCCFLLFAPIIIVAQQKPAPVPVIFDSDMGPDYDDAGAITLLHAFADSGYATILATVASTKYEGVAAVFNVFNTWFKRPDILIGVPKGS